MVRFNLYSFCNRLQAEYVSKATAAGADDKSILECLKNSYDAKAKELEEAEVIAR